MTQLQPFKNVPSLKPGKTAFDLSYENKFTCDMGYLIPTMRKLMMPGDHFKFGNQSIVRFQPLVAPVLHEVNIETYYFAVPIRILDENWEDFITGGPDGNNSYSLPRWRPEDQAHMAIGSLWDYFHFPVFDPPVDPSTFDEESLPLIYLLRGYNMIYNEYFRDQDLQSEVNLDQQDLLVANYEKDYFNTCRPWQQKGIAPAIPIVGSSVFGSSISDPTVNLSGGTNGQAGVVQSSAVGYGQVGRTDGTPVIVGSSFYANLNSPSFLDYIQNNIISSSGFTPSDLRLAFAIQRWQELNSRSGTRYTEFLKNRFGTAPRDERLQRPEYCGGTKSTVIFSEVLQTSESGSQTPQGNMAGHGISVQSSFAGDYFAQEFCYIIGITRIVPKPSYQQGIDREFMQLTRWDFPFPEFVNLSEQAVELGELYWIGKTLNDRDILGYQSRFDEHRTSTNKVSGLFRKTLNYWHLGRIFDTTPALNSDLLQFDIEGMKRIFSVQNEHGILVSMANTIKAIRPLPYIGNPGLLDHVYGGL